MVQKTPSYLDSTLADKIQHEDLANAKRVIDIDNLVGAHWDRAVPTYNSTGSATNIKFYQDTQQEITDITAIADVSGSLNNKYLLLYSGVDATEYYLWLNVAGAGTDPAISGKTGIEVSIATNDPAGVVSKAIELAIQSVASADFSVTLIPPTVRIENTQYGATTDASDVSTGFDISVSQQGVSTLVKDYDVPQRAGYVYIYNEFSKSLELYADALRKSTSADRTAFGSVSVASRIIDIQASFAESIPSDIFDFTVTGTGSAGIVDSVAFIQTGTTPSSSGSYFSLDEIRYRAGQENFMMLTAIFDNAGTTGDYAYVGLQDDDNKYVFGFRDGSFGMGIMRGGTWIYWVNQADFNGDKLDGSIISTFTRDGVPEAYDHTKEYIFELIIPYLGVGTVVLRMMSPDGNWVDVNSIKHAGLDNKPHTFNPNLPVRADVFTTSGANMKVGSSSLSAGYYGTGKDNRISQGNSSTTLLGAGETFTGKGLELLDGSGQITVSFYADVDSATNGVKFQYSHDGITWKTATENGFSYTAPRLARYQYGINARYFRVQYTNGATPQTEFSLQTILLANASRTSIHRLGDNVSAERSVELVKAGITGENPNGIFTNVRTQGSSATNSSTTPLDANGIFRGTWIRWQDSFVKIGGSCKADVAGTLYLDFSDSDAPTDGVDTDVDFSGPFEFDPTQVPTLKGHVPVLSKWVRARYVNGPAAQSEFNLNVAFFTSDPGTPLQDLRNLPNKGSSAGVVRAVPAIPTAAGTGYQETPVDSLTGNPTVTVSNVRDDLLLRPMDTASANQVTVGTSAVQLDPSPISNRREVMLSNDGSISASIGFSSGITFTSNSFLMKPGAVRTWSLAPTVEVWAVAEDTGGTETTLRRSGSTATGTATSPTNALTSDNARASIGANAETIVVSGYTAGTTNDLVSVKMGIEARKEAGQTETVTLEETQIGATTGAGTVSTASLAGGTNQLYVAYVTRNDNTGTVTQIQADGQFMTPILQNVTAGNRRIDVWYAYGDFTAGAVTASMSTSTNAHIVAYRFSNANPTTPIQDSGSTTGATASVGGPTLSGTANGYSLLGVSHTAASGTAGTGYTEDSDQTNGTGSNIDSLASESKALTLTGSEAASYTLASASDWAAVGVTISPATAVDPQVDLTYKLSAVAGPTSGTVIMTTTSDADYTVDITGDRSWVFGDIANIEVTATGSTISAAAAEVDHVFVEIVDTTGSTTRISIVQGGRDLV